MLSFFPPTDENMAAIQLNEPIKVIKELKKKEILKHSGKLICNKSINEYLKGGKGYQDSLRLSLENKINTVIDDRHKVMKFHSKVIIQLDKLVAKGFVTVTFKSKTETSLQNFFMIKKVEWTDKVNSTVESSIDKIQENIIKKVAHEYNSTYFDTRTNLSKILKQIREYALIKLYLNALDERINIKLSEQQKILEQYNSLPETDITVLNKLLDIQKNIAQNEYNIFNDYSKEKFTKENEVLAIELLDLEVSNKNKYGFYLEMATKIRIENEISLLRKLKSELLKSHQWGYDDFVEEFQSQNFQISNQMLSLDDITKLVNHTRNLYGKSTLKTNKEIIEELQNEISWDFNAH